jgi:nudix-type nucleoside diphosphatase (YffH/AdpP family)
MSHVAITRQELVYEGWTRLRRVALRMPDGEEVERHIEDHGTAVTVLPYDPERRVALLVSMPRAPVIEAGEEDLLEAVAGRIEGEEPETCAHRELLEEAGLRGTQLVPIGQVWSMPSLSTERIHLYLARFRAADRVASGGGAEDENEGISVRELSLDALASGIGDGTIRDMKTMLLVQALMLREPDLFKRLPQTTEYLHERS